MPAVNKIYIQVDLESKEAEKAVDEVNKKIKDIGENTEKSSAKATTGIKRISASVETAAGSMDKLASAIGSLGLLEMGRQLLKMGDDMNRVRLGMQNMEGGASAFILIQDMARRTGASFQFLLKAAQDLVNAGEAPVIVASKLGLLYDAARHAGKGMEEVMHITEKMRQVRAKGFVAGEDIGVWAQVGILGAKALQKQFNITQQEMQRVMSTSITPDVYEKTIFKMLEKTKGAAEKMKAELPSAAFSALEAKVISLAGELEKTLAPVLIKVAQLLGDLVDKAQNMLAAFNRLPDWVKNLAIAFGLLALSIKAVTSAMTLWNLVIPAGVSLMARFMSLWAGLKVVGSIAANMATGLGLMEGAMVTLRVAAVGLGAALNAIPWVAIITALAIIGTGIYKNVKAPDPEEEKKKQEAFADYDELRVKTAALEKRMREAKLALPERPRMPNVAAAGGIVPALTAREEGYQGLIEDALKKNMARIEKNEQEVKRARDYGANLLANAQRDQLRITQETIAALGFAWEQHWENTKIDAQATADALKALQVSITSEVLKQMEIVKTAQEKAALESIAMQRKLAIARMETIPDSGYAAQQQMAEAQFTLRQAELRQAADVAIRANDVYTAKQLSGIGDTAGKSVQGAGTAYEVRGILEHAMRTTNQFRQTNRELNAIEEKKVIEQTEEARVALAKQTNAILFQQEKEQRDAETQYAIQQINVLRDYQIAMVTAVEAYTRDEKLDQIEDVANAQLDALDKIREAQQANILAAAAQFQAIIETARAAGTISDIQAQMRLAGYKQFVTDPALKALQLQASSEEQQVRIEGWKQGNQVIIEEQKQVYESINGFMGELFDAFLEKNRSVWSAIGDVIKRTLLGAIKSVVTSHLAAALTSMLGYGTVAVRGGPLGGVIAIPTGAGAAPPVNAPSVNYAAIIPGAGQGILTESYVGRPPSDYMGGGDWGAGEIAPTRIPGYESPAAAPTQLGRIKASFNIGKPVYRARPDGGTEMVPWANATAGERMASMFSSEGMATMATTVGLPMLMGSLQRKGVAAGVQGVAGAALTGYGVAAMFPALGLSGLGGAVLGAGLGLFAAGYKARGKKGLAMTVAGGAMSGLVVGAMIGAAGGPIGMAAGALIGAAVGAGVGIYNMLRDTPEKQARSLIRQTYGIDIADQGILGQVAELAKQRFGGDVRLAVHSSEVQEMVRLYGLMTAQNANLPRPMYGATYAQSAAGGLQLQPVYSGGRMVASPYSGTTTTQVQQGISNSPPVFLQLNPQQASSLFTGQVVQVMGENPGAVGAANTTAARSGQGRQAQSGALLEPSTVMA